MPLCDPFGPKAHRVRPVHIVVYIADEITRSENNRPTNGTFAKNILRVWHPVFVCKHLFAERLRTDPSFTLSAFNEQLHTIGPHFNAFATSINASNPPTFNARALTSPKAEIDTEPL